MSTSDQAKAEAQAKFEAERAEKQARHLAECTVKDCDWCKQLRGEPVKREPGPRCPACHTYDPLAPDRAPTLVQRLAARLLKAREDIHAEVCSGGTYLECRFCADDDIALLREAGAIQ